MNESFETVATVIGERVAIIGSRPERVEGRLTEASWARRARVFSYVESLARRSKSTVIVTGDADGADHWAADAARKYGLQVVVKPADWKKHGKGAGMIRNKYIVDDADRIVAFLAGDTRGSLNTISLAEKSGKPVEVVR